MTSGGVWSVLRWNGLTGGHWLLRALVKCQIIEKAVTRQAFTTESFIIKGENYYRTQNELYLNKFVEVKFYKKALKYLNREGALKCFP